MAARIKALNLYQKIILLICAVMVVVFTVLYPITISRVGFLYRDTILMPGESDGITVYTGKIQGEETAFTVSSDKTVRLRHGEKVYGPYTAREDPTAIPEDEDLASHMTGVEVYCGKELIFRGGVVEVPEMLWLYNEDGSVESFGINFSYGTDSGTVYDMDGNVIDPMEPSVSTVLKLMGEPELTHKGTWLGWFGGVVFCIFTVFSILFADEIFRYGMRFQIRNPENAEPSEWEIASRYISWTVIPIMTLALFIMGLQ